VGARLAAGRVTPRFNADVNGYWMCDIGRFGYDWVEGDTAAARSVLRPAGGRSSRCRGTTRAGTARSAAGAGSADPSVRFLVSAHAAIEELFVLRRDGAGAGRQRRPARGDVSLDGRGEAAAEQTRSGCRRSDAPNVTGHATSASRRAPVASGAADLSDLRAVSRPVG
jgi:hypothetical protein